MADVSISLSVGEWNKIRSLLLDCADSLQRAIDAWPRAGFIDEYRDISARHKYTAEKILIAMRRLDTQGEPVNIPRPLEERFDDLLTVVGYIATQSIQYKGARESALAKLENLRGSNVSSQNTV